MQINNPEYCTGLYEGWYFSFGHEQFGPYNLKSAAFSDFNKIKRILASQKTKMVELIRCHD